MGHPIESAVVRIRATRGKVAGTGFLVNDRHVFTCAHVVSWGLGLTAQPAKPPDRKVRLDFPLAAPGQILTARVVLWQSEEDIAGLELDSAPPLHARAAPLARVDDLWGHSFRAFGFPPGYEEGVWAAGVFRAPQAAGWVQIEDVNQTGYFVKPGFSGAPVWDEDLGGVVGIVVAAETKPSIRAAFLIPNDALKRAGADWGVGLRKHTVSLSSLPCPYPGMLPYSARDARFFFGREDETKQLRLRLRHQNFILIIGPSGSGKSSLVFAGLVPELERRDPGRWTVKTMRPGEQPLESLVETLGVDKSPTAQGWQRSFEEALKRCTQGHRLLFVVDQLEELFTQAPQEAQAEFIAALKVLRKNQDSALVLTMRAGFYEELMNSNLWPIESTERMEVAPLRGTALRDAIVKPAAAFNVDLEEALIDHLLTDAAHEPGVLPLVQETMVLLWDEIERGVIPFRAYEALGDEEHSGLAVAVALKADATIASLQPEERALARRIFLRLVQMGEGRADSRRQQRLDALKAAGDDPEQFRQVLTHLVDERLLTLTGDELLGCRVDIAHEALIEGWPLLQFWLAEQRDAEQTRRRLEAKAAEWVRLGRSKGGLLDQMQLIEVEAWLRSTQAAEIGHSDDLIALVGASRSAIDEVENLRANYSQMQRLNELIMRFAGNVSHELRVPLAVIKLYAALARKGRSDKHSYYMQTIEQEAHRLETIVENILDLTRLEQGDLAVHPTTLPLKRIVMQVLEFYQGVAEMRGIELVDQVPEDLPPLRVDRNHLIQMLFNLLENALKYTPRGRRIWVEARQTASDARCLLELEVGDEGTGIPENEQGRVFERFYRGSNNAPGSSGTGLGLAIVQELVQVNGGSVTLRSELGEGSVFTLRFPLGLPNDSE